MKQITYRLSSLLLTMVILWPALLLTSCGEEKLTGKPDTEADSLIHVAYKIRDYEQIITLSDLHQQSGALSPIKAYYWRGYAYSRLRKMRQAETEWKQAVAQKVETDEGLEYYAKSANRLTGLLYMKFDYDGALRVAVPAIRQLTERNYTLNTDFANLQTFIGNCQLKMGNMQEAANSYNQAFQCYQQAIDADDDIANHTTAIIGIITITEAYVQTGNYEEASDWANRFDSMLLRYQQHPQADEYFIDKQRARLHFFRACALEGLGRTDEATKAYQAGLSTRWGRTTEGRVESTSYLMAAKRWSEAAANYEMLRHEIERFDMKMTLDNIRTYLLPKFKANIEAHRTDSALAAGKWICSTLDSAIIWERQNTALELATIYDTQQKETEIAEQQISLSHQRLLTTVITLVLIILGLGLFIFFRHRAAMRLETAYRHLEVANARAEESSRMKSDFIQQISHEIRTPLNVLSGFTQVITTPDIELDEETRKDINRKITENTNRITGLVNKMLELSEAHSKTVIEQTDRISPAKIASDAVAASGIEDATHLTFHVETTPEAESAELVTNHQAAVRALSLLLDNARKFTAPAEARRKEPIAKMADAILRVTVGTRQVVFAVEDTGIGIPPKEADHVFDEFVQLDEYYDGTGIGLPVARSLARRLGGDVLLDTAYTAGARFVLTLPL